MAMRVITIPVWDCVLAFLGGFCLSSALVRGFAGGVDLPVIWLASFAGLALGLAFEGHANDR